MAAIVNADVSISAAGNIRWTGAATTNKHTVLEFIQYLMDKQDDAQAAGDDLLDITVDTPFNRSTDQILTLNSPFNIDDTFATHLYDGSVSQTEPTLLGETLYSGLGVIGPVETGTEYMILQNGKVLPAFWGTGINPEAAPSLVFSRHLVKSKYAGSKIDGQRITVLARELSDQYRRFPVTLGTGNSVAAIGNGADIFNTTADATIAGWTTIVNTEGFQELNIDNTGAAGQEFYSQWEKGSQSINQTYERTKWISQRAHTADSNAETGNNFIIDDNNDSTQGIGTEWSATASGEMLVGAKMSIKIGAGTPTGTLYAELWDSDDIATAKPTGGSLARSEPVLASAIASNSVYQDVIFRFNRFNPATGASQLAGLTLTGDQEYFIVLRNAEGTSTAYFHAQGDTSTADNGNSANDLSGTWTGTGTSALKFEVYTSPVIHDVPGEIFQGINIEVGYDGEAGAGVVEDDICMWGTLVSYDTLASGPFRPGELVTFKTGSTLKSGGTVLYDDGVDELLVALDSPAASVLTNNDTITGLTSGATAAVDFPSHVGNGTDDLDFATATPGTITRVTSGGSFIDEKFKAGHKLFVTGSASNNNGGVAYNITNVTATVITVAEGTTSELNVAATVTLAAKDEELGGGTGIILAKDDNGTTGELYLQVFSGVNPVNNNRIRTDDMTADPLTDYVDATATLNSRTVIPEFLGTSTGSNIIGAYGIGFPTDDVGASDRFTSLDNASRVPPNNVVFTVSGLVAGEDRVLVGPRTDTSLNTAQLATDVTLSGATETVIQCSAVVPTETPTAGTVRVKLNSGIFKRVRYQSNSGNDYTILADDTFVDGDVDTSDGASGNSVNIVGHAFVTSDKIRLSNSGGALPGGLSAATDYWIIKLDASNIQFASSEALAIAGTDIDITSAAGGGTHTIEVQDFEDFSSDNATQPKDVFISYIDVLARATTESFTAVFTTSRNLIVRVRDGGATPIKTFEATSAQFLSTAQTVAATRTSDA